MSNATPATSDRKALVNPTNQLAWSLIIAGLVGFIGATALTIEKIHLWLNPGDSLSCDFNAFISCKSVMLQKQASIFGFPNSFVGVVGFALVIALGIATLLGFRYSRATWRVFFSGVGMAFVFALWLFSQSVFVINVLCPYCIVVWLGTLPLFFRVYGFGLKEGFLEGPKFLVARAAGFYEWAWVWTLAVEAIVLISIILVFLDEWRLIFVGLF